MARLRELDDDDLKRQAEIIRAFPGRSHAKHVRRPEVGVAVARVGAGGDPGETQSLGFGHAAPDPSPLHPGFGCYSPLVKVVPARG